MKVTLSLDFKALQKAWGCTATLYVSLLDLGERLVTNISSFIVLDDSCQVGARAMGDQASPYIASHAECCYMLLFSCTNCRLCSVSACPGRRMLAILRSCSRDAMLLHFNGKLKPWRSRRWVWHSELRLFHHGFCGKTTLKSEVRKQPSPMCLVPAKSFPMLQKKTVMGMDFVRCSDIWTGPWAEAWQ